MIDNKKITVLRLERQHLTRKANETEYTELYRDLQPGQNVYWNGFGDPPTLTYRADFDDMEYNRKRQRTHSLVKGRFAGGNLGWIMAEDMELFACMYQKPLDKPTPRQLALLELIEREGPLNIQQMKESTGMLVKEITPALHRLQEAFLIYEDQNEGQEDRGWYQFGEMFPDVNLEKYSRIDALKILLRRFAYRIVCFDIKMVKSYFKVPEKEIKSALMDLVAYMEIREDGGNFMLQTDFELLQTYPGVVQKSVFAMHRNDFLVKSYEHILKDKYPHSYPDTLYYLLIDGEFRGAVVGKFRYTPEVEDVLVDLTQGEVKTRKEKILQAVHALCGANNPIKRYQEEENYV